MNPNELENKIKDLELELSEMRQLVANMQFDKEQNDDIQDEMDKQIQTLTVRMNDHKHNFHDDTSRVDHTIVDNQKIRFMGINESYEIYRQAGDSGELRIDPVNDYAGAIISIGSVNKPITLQLIGGDEALLKADNNTNTTQILVEPGSVKFETNKGNDFFVKFPNGGGDPSSTSTGALAVVSGVLKIYDGAAWTVVGTQT